MRAILSFLFLCCVSSAQVNEPDRLMQAFTDRAMADQVARMATDERIKMYETLANYKPGDFHYQSLLAGSFIQKMRETMDPGYLDRASKIVDAVLSADGADYEALRLRSQIELERHNFTKVAEYSRELIASSPEDPWNWGSTIRPPRHTSAWSTCGPICPATIAHRIIASCPAMPRAPSK